MKNTPISDVCQRLQITPRAARFYEEKGLVSSIRTWNGRSYSDQQVERLSIVSRCRRAGLPLEDIPAILAIYDGSEPSFRTRRAIIDRLEKRLEEMLAQTEALRQEIARLERH